MGGAGHGANGVCGCVARLTTKPGEAEAEVHIVEKDGVLTGKVVRSLRDNPKPKNM
jgi:hypothetical protein